MGEFGMARSWKGLAAAVLCASRVLVMEACGGGSTTSTPGTAASIWTGTFCGAGIGVRWKLSVINNSLASQLRTGSEPELIKSDLAGNIESAITSNDEALNRLGKDGTPAVEEGNKIADAVKSTFLSAGQQLEALRPTVQAIPTGQGQGDQFAAALKSISQKVYDISQDLAGSLRKPDRFRGYPKINEAATSQDEFGTADTCRRFQETPVVVK